MRNFREIFGFGDDEDDDDDSPDLGPALLAPTTPEQRLELLEELVEDVQEWEHDHASFGVRGSTDQIRLSPLHHDFQLGTLTCHAGSHTCRVSIKLDRESDGDRLIPVGVQTFSGTCNDFRRRRACLHTLAALRQLRKVLGDTSSQLRTKLFFLDETPPPDRWKVALRLVDDFLATATPDQVPQLPQTRIAWRVDYSTQTNPWTKEVSVRLSVESYEQKVGKGGNWTKGRRIYLDEFLRSESSWSHEADRRLVETYHAMMIRSYATYGPRELNVYDMLEALAGHPLLTWATDPTQTIEIERGEFGLLVLEDQNRLWRIVPTINGREPQGSMIWSQFGQFKEKPIWIDREANRILLGVGDRRAVTFAASLGSLPDPIPPEGHAAFLAKLAMLQDRLPVTLPANLAGGVEAADDRLFLRCVPQQPEGITAELVVQPAKERAACAPGEGAAVLTILRDGKQLRFERNLADERRRAGECVDALRLERYDSPRKWLWHLPENEDALDLLALLADNPQDGLVVQWPEGAERKVSHTIQPSALRVQIESQHDWFGLSGSVDVDGQEIELAKILHALRKGSRYVEVGPQQFVRLAQALRQSLEAIDDVAYETKGGKLEFDITAAPVLQKMCDPTVELKTCLAFEESLRKLQAAEELTPEPPVTLAADLRDYQVEGFRWLSRLASWGMGGCLADDMGLGKTVQTLALLITRAELGPALVLAPTSVAFNWVREAQRFAPTLRTILYRESDRGEVLQNLAAGDVVVISYGLLLRDADKLAKVKWGTLVLDEAQKIKNSTTKTAQAVRQIEADWRLALTGTPLENHLGELWSIFRAVCPGLLGSWDRFRTKYAEPIERQRDPARRRALSRLMRPFILRRTKSEVLEELPDRTEIIRTAELTPEERARYQAARLAAVMNLAGAGESEKGGAADRRFEVLAALTRLRQLACHPRLVDAEWPGGSAKLELFMEIVEELREGKHRALVFSQFVQHLDLIRGALDAAGITYQYLDGQTPPKEREKRVDAFQRGEGDLFLISLKAGGTGLNLTAADYVIHMDPWWNPAVEDQATDRAHRIGQTRPVTVYRLVTKDTIEEQILALHAGKRHLVADVLEGTDQAAKLSTRDLVDLIRGEAVEEETAPPQLAGAGSARGKPAGSKPVSGKQR